MTFYGLIVSRLWLFVKNRRVQFSLYFSQHSSPVTNCDVMEGGEGSEGGNEPTPAPTPTPEPETPSTPATGYETTTTEEAIEKATTGTVSILATVLAGLAIASLAGIKIFSKKH